MFCSKALLPFVIDLPKVERLGTLGARPIQKKNGEESCGKPVVQDIPGGLARSNLGMFRPKWSNFLKSLRCQKAILRYQRWVVLRKSTIWFLVLTRDPPEAK